MARPRSPAPWCRSARRNDRSRDHGRGLRTAPPDTRGASRTSLPGPGLRAASTSSFLRALPRGVLYQLSAVDTSLGLGLPLNRYPKRSLIPGSVSSADSIAISESSEPRDFQNETGGDKRMRRRGELIRRGLGVAALGVLAVAPVHAAGFGIFEQGTRAMGTAGAFTGQADDP